MSTKSILALLAFLVDVLKIIPTGITSVETAVSAYGSAKNDKERAEAILSCLSTLTKSMTDALTVL